jgi:hypothetical protein
VRNKKVQRERKGEREPISDRDRMTMGYRRGEREKRAKEIVRY